MKPIPSCPGYFAGEDGLIYRNGKARKGVPNKAGYLTVMVSIKNKQWLRYAHRLVCEAYHGPCPPEMQCRHLDGTRTNNIPDNLQWGDRATNEKDKVIHGTLVKGEMMKGSILTAEIVLDARARARRGEMIKDIAKSYGVPRNGMGDAICGKTWAHLPDAVPRGSTRTRAPDGTWRSVLGT